MLLIARRKIRHIEMRYENKCHKLTHRLKETLGKRTIANSDENETNDKEKLLGVCGQLQQQSSYA